MPSKFTIGIVILLLIYAVVLQVNLNSCSLELALEKTATQRLKEALAKQNEQLKLLEANTSNLDNERASLQEMLDVYYIKANEAAKQECEAQLDTLFTKFRTAMALTK